MGQGAGASGDATQSRRKRAGVEISRLGTPQSAAHPVPEGFLNSPHPLLLFQAPLPWEANVNMATPDDKKDITQAERTLSAADEKADHANYERVDDEVARYANATGVALSEAEDARLKKLIDRRVLPIMVFTYFLQALDKGTMSFASIMGIRADVPGLEKNSNVRPILLRVIESR